MQAASASTPGLKAPSSLAVGAAIPSTKQAVFSQIDTHSSQSPKASRDESSAGTAAAGQASVTKPAVTKPAVTKPAKPVVARRSLDGLDAAVADGVKTLCQVRPVT